MSDSDEPTPALFATIHHRSETRPDGYTEEELSMMNVEANKHIPELHDALMKEHKTRFPNMQP